MSADRGRCSDGLASAASPETQERLERLIEFSLFLGGEPQVDVA